MFRFAVGLTLLVATLPAGAVSWADAGKPCADSASLPDLNGSSCIRATVPLRHEAPESGTIELFVRRIPAGASRDRRGEIWLLAGGPGEAGASLHPMITTFRRAFPGYDLIIPDHRGVGASERLCPVQEARDSDDGVALAASEWGACIGAMYADQSRTKAFTITQAAWDLSVLMSRYRGDGQVFLYGVSYGTQLALRALQVAPMPLDGLILDGLIPPETAGQWDLSHRTDLVDEVGRTILGKEEIATYQRVLATVASADWRDEVPGGDLRRFLGTLLNFPSLRARIPVIVEGLAVHDASALTATVAELKEMLAAMGQGGNDRPSLPLVMLISSSENNARPGLTHEMVEAESKDALFVSSIPGFLVDSPVPAYEKDEWFGHTPRSIPRTLIVHGTLDPNTPYAGARAHEALLAKAGPISFNTVKDGAHLLSYAAPTCFVAAATAFVENTSVPATCVEP